MRPPPREPEPTMPSPILSLGPEQHLVRYEVPTQKKKPTRAKAGSFLTDATKSNLKKGAVAAGAAAGTYALKKGSDTLLDRYGDGVKRKAIEVAMRYGQPVVRAADRAVGNVLDYFEGVPPPQPYQGVRNAYSDLLQRQYRSDDDNDSEGFDEFDIRGQRMLSSPVDTPFGRTSEIVADADYPRLSRDAVARSRTPEYRQSTLRRARRSQSGSGLSEFSPCAHLREAGRAVFTMAEQGDLKGARKELRELTQHLKEIKSYVATIK